MFKLPKLVTLGALTSGASDPISRFRTIGHAIETKRWSNHSQLRPVMSRSRVVIGVIGDDIHIVGNRIMQLALEECGFSVYNIRTRNRPERFVQAALEDRRWACSR
jgi:methanogenic corrinoid protein MtbC1